MWAAAPSVRFKVWGSAADLVAPNVLAAFRPDEMGLTTSACGGTASARLLPRWCDTCGQRLSVAPAHSAESVAVVPIGCGATVVLIAVCGPCEPVELRPVDLVLRADLS